MAGDGDIEAHVATYTGVMGLLKWSALGSAAMTFIIILLIS